MLTFFHWDYAEIGRRWGWKCVMPGDREGVARALRGGAPVAVWQDAGRRDWWQSLGGWPHHFERIASWPDANRWQAIIVISDRVLPSLPGELAERVIAYRPPTLAVGLGCNRGVLMADVAEAVSHVLRGHGLSEESITAVAGSVRRKHEAGLQEFADEREIPFLTYAADKLAIVRPAHAGRLGVAATCEPAAMLAAGVRQLVVPKSLVGRIAVAVARRPT